MHLNGIISIGDVGLVMDYRSYVLRLLVDKRRLIVV